MPLLPRAFCYIRRSCKSFDCSASILHKRARFQLDDAFELHDVREDEPGPDGVAVVSATVYVKLSEAYNIEFVLREQTIACPLRLVARLDGVEYATVVIQPGAYSPCRPGQAIKMLAWISEVSQVCSS